MQTAAKIIAPLALLATLLPPVLHLFHVLALAAFHEHRHRLLKVGGRDEVGRADEQLPPPLFLGRPGEVLAGRIAPPLGFELAERSVIRSAGSVLLGSFR